jgi:hypothetical protein
MIVEGLSDMLVEKDMAHLWAFTLALYSPK